MPYHTGIRLLCVAQNPANGFPARLLECQQWRHGMSSVIFQGDLHFDFALESVRGLLICEVHAENLSSHVRRQFPVRITTRKSASTDQARDLVQKLIDSSR